MIIYNLHTCKINKFSQILKDSRYVSKIWLPKKVADKYKSKLITDYNKLQNSDEEDKKIIQKYYVTSLYIRILMYQNLRKSLYLNVNKKNKELFKDEFKRDFKTEDLTFLDNKINRLKLQYDTENVEDETPYDFDAYIRGLGYILDDNNIGDKYIYLLPGLEKDAIEKINSKKTTENA